VKKAFFALVENNVHAAALWDSKKMDIVGTSVFITLGFSPYPLYRKTSNKRRVPDKRRGVF